MSAISNIFHKITSVGTSDEFSEFKNKKIRFFNSFILISLSAPIFFMVQEAIMDYPAMVLLDFGLFIVLASGLLLNHLRLFGLAQFVLFFLASLYLLLTPLFFGDTGIEYYYFTFIITGFYVLEKRIHLILLSVHITILFGITKYYSSILPYPEEYMMLDSIYYYPFVVITSALLVIAAISVFKNETEKYQKQIIKNQEDLDRKIIELEEKESLNQTLIRELNHRVKNNMQLVSSLFQMQAEKSKDPETSSAMKYAGNRIDTISILHQMLYTKTDKINANLDEYIIQLVHNIESAFSDKNFKIETEVDHTILPVATTTHIGLIVNEMLTNAIKYGINPDETKNKIRLKISVSHTDIYIHVTDNGPGIQQSKLKEGSFGFELLRILTSQYNGEISFSENGDNTVSIRLNLEKARYREKILEENA